MDQYKRVLVVDDEKPIAKMISMLLLKNGYVVDTASNGEEALETMKVYWPDILVLDVMMPKINGYRVSRMIKLMGEMGGPRKTPKIILVTARDLRNDSEREEAMSDFSKADAVLYKPFRPVELLDKIKSLTG